jgi:hypothetical protein
VRLPRVTNRNFRSAVFVSIWLLTCPGMLQLKCRCQMHGGRS